MCINMYQYAEGIRPLKAELVVSLAQAVLFSVAALVRRVALAASRCSGVELPLASTREESRWQACSPRRPSSLAFLLQANEKGVFHGRTLANVRTGSGKGHCQPRGQCRRGPGCSCRAGGSCQSTDECYCHPGGGERPAGGACR